MRHTLVAGNVCYLSPVECRKFTPLSGLDFLHRSAKLKYSYVASSLLFLHMKVHESGIDPVFSDGTVEKVSSNTM